MSELTALELSRLQFGLTAMYHFLFVPLTLGLSLIIAIMESVYVMTNKVIWKEMTQFWGILFGINFAMGVCTGVPLEFQFGTNWSYYAHYVGDVFGSLLAIEGLMAFFLEATFIGLFFFGWNRLSKLSHLVVTWLVAIGSNLSALWILLANGWMQNPVGSAFNTDTLRMELTSFYEIMFNPVSQSKFVHTVSAGYVTGAVFVLSISAFYLLRGRHIEFAKRSMVVAASFGLASALSVVVLGDESGYMATEHQKMKIAAVEAVWETEPAPAGLVLFGVPDQKSQTTAYEIKIPWLLGIIATRSLDGVVLGIKDLVHNSEKNVREGMVAYGALQEIKKNRDDSKARALFEEHKKSLGHGLLLKKYTPNVVDATEDQIKSAALDTVPNVSLLFWSFRVMVGLGLYFIVFFGYAFYRASRRRFTDQRWFLRVCLISMPLPWIAAEAGWFVAEHGRQPWTIDGILPTFLSGSSLPYGSVLTTLIAFVLFYSVLAVVDVLLMLKYIKLGPTPHSIKGASA
jgi:cytochrome d ubiquinol oxidase subunit I